MLMLHTMNPWCLDRKEETSKDACGSLGNRNGIVLKGRGQKRAGWDKGYEGELCGLEAEVRSGRVDVMKARKRNGILLQMEGAKSCIYRRGK